MGTQNLDPSVLTEEEIAAINGDAEGDSAAAADASDDAGADAGAAGKDDDGGDDANDGGAEAGDSAAAADAGAAGDGAAAAAASSGAAAAPAQGDDAQAEAAAEDDDDMVRPAFTYKLPDDFQDRVKAVDEAEAQLETKHEEGEITAAEYRAELRRLAKERATLDGMQTKADIAAEAAAQAEKAVLQTAFSAVAKAGAEVGIDYRKDQAKFKQLDTVVKALANDDANMGRSAKWLLMEAHKVVMAMNGVKAAATAPAPAPKPADVKAKAAADRKVDLSAVPKTLANVPGGDHASDIGGEFDDILALDGQALEDALETMSRSAPQRFAAFQAYQAHR